MQKDFPDSLGLAWDSFTQGGTSEVGPKNKKSNPCHTVTAAGRLARALRREQQKCLERSISSFQIWIQTCKQDAGLEELGMKWRVLTMSGMDSIRHWLPLLGCSSLNLAIALRTDPVAQKNKSDRGQLDFSNTLHLIYTLPWRPFCLLCKIIMFKKTARTSPPCRWKQETCP